LGVETVCPRWKGGRKGGRKERGGMEAAPGDWVGGWGGRAKTGKSRVGRVGGCGGANYGCGGKHGVGRGVDKG
jgi:hypothetical protein